MDIYFRTNVLAPCHGNLTKAISNDKVAPWPKFLSFPCRFLGKNGQVVGWHPLESWCPLLAKSWICHWHQELELKFWQIEYIPWYSDAALNENLQLTGQDGLSTITSSLNIKIKQLRFIKFWIMFNEKLWLMNLAQKILTRGSAQPEFSDLTMSCL